jgi:hypothetical protein
MVWRRIHGQHADVVSQSTIRVCLVLSEKCGATECDNGSDLSLIDTFPVLAGNRLGDMHHIP